MRTITSFLTRATMYRLVLYGLAAIAAPAFVLSAVGILSFSVGSLAISLATLLASCWGTNALFERLYGTTTSTESLWITALILFLTLAPPASGTEVLVIASAGALAITSKYVLSLHARHVFNPAAIALVIISLAGSGLATWWVGSPFLLPIVAVVGLLLVRKIHRFDVVLAFLITALAVSLAFAFLQGTSFVSTISMLALSGPLLFFATIMLTEPITMPPSRNLRIIYGIIVGGMYACEFHFGIFYATPHLALILGNLYSYAVSAKERIILRLRSLHRLSANVYEFAFRPSTRLTFAAGQYLEWTLPHPSADSGGNRRYFTISSSPAERDIRVGVRIDHESSSFKRSLLALKEGDPIIVTSLAGDFVLPKDPLRKLLFVAGGVGITPFISMLRYLIDAGDARDAVLLYVTSAEGDVAYDDVLRKAADVIGLTVMHVRGRNITSAQLAQYVPDASDRSCYVSGPEGMVTTYKALLSGIGVLKRSIHTDYFTGFGSV